MLYLCHRRDLNSKIRRAFEHAESEGSAWRVLQIPSEQSGLLKLQQGFRLTSTVSCANRYGRVAHAVVIPVASWVLQQLSVELPFAETCGQVDQVTQVVDALDAIDADSVHSKNGGESPPRYGQAKSLPSLDDLGVTDIWGLDPATNRWDFARRIDDGRWEGTLNGIRPGYCYIVR